jgi:hypothetical protein
MSDYYLLRLGGQGDQILTVVGPATWEWIHSMPPAELLERHAMREKIPPPALEENRELTGGISRHRKTVDITIGSWQNDRALDAPGLTFHDDQALDDWREKNNIMRFKGTYVGCIY